jgi:hypothetical protein
MTGEGLARDDEEHARARHSLASTIPADVPSSRRAWLSDRPGWCVDLGWTLTAMTTCELWLGLARGDVRPQMKVWREGMPYWEPVATVPEFALALPDAPVWAAAAAPGPNAVTTAALVAAVVEMRERATIPQSVLPEAPPVVEGLTFAPSADFVTPAPVVVENRTAPPPASGVRERAAQRLDRRSALSVAAGAAVAILALALATTAPRLHASNHEPALPAHAAALGAPDLLRGEPAIAAPRASSPVAAPQSARRGPRSMDRGQRRARVSAEGRTRTF